MLYKKSFNLSSLKAKHKLGGAAESFPDGDGGILQIQTT
jgi:hypothetical protein